MALAKDRKEQLVDTALRLFYKNGFHATGIDEILAAAGVAKMTLYKHFKSKNELILAALRRRDEQFRNWVMNELERRSRGKSAAQKLIVIFDVVDSWFHQEEFYGCAFLNASAEFSNHDDPVHMEAAMHKKLMLGLFEKLAREAGAPDPRELAHQLDLLVSGAVVHAQVTGDKAAAQLARRTAELIVADALGART
jgi:AcrR family transcriptional regulator